VPAPFILFPASGYAKTQSQVPVDVRAVYSRTGVDGGYSEAGIASSRGWVSAFTDIENQSDSHTETALALVNTEDAQVNLTVRLSNNKGEWVQTKYLKLEPHAHRARFVSEIFDDLDLQDFSGTMRIGASGRVTGVVVRTRDGFPTAAMTLSAAEE